MSCWLILDKLNAKFTRAAGHRNESPTSMNGELSVANVARRNKSKNRCEISASPFYRHRRPDGIGVVA
ncbi:MAG: hypothetical protein ACRCWB_07195 [Enterovibrio sp.]